MAHMLPAHSALAMLTSCPVCRRTLRGRIFEPENISHVDVDSAGRAFDPSAGRGRAHEVVARSCGRSVLQRCSARVAQTGRGACFRALVRVWGHAGLLPCLLWVV